MIIRKRLHVERLEQRRMFAVFIDSIPQIQVAEGSLAQLSSATFFDSSPGGNYSATVDWGDESRISSAQVTGASGTTGNLSIEFDYRFDTSNFFTPERRRALEAAAEIVVGRLGDSLDGFTSLGNNIFTANLINPSTGQQITVPNFGVDRNEFIVFVGARNLDGGTLAESGPGGGSANADFFQIARARGQIGVPQTDFAPWGGGISFDDQVNWHFDFTSTDQLENGENDFVSVAVHELLHVMGVTISTESYARFVSGNVFNGPRARAEYDLSGSPPLAPDNSHLREGTMDGGQEAALDPTINQGTRKLPTELDFAILEDIGWEILPEFQDGVVSASHTFDDNGVFTPTLTVRNGSEVATETFRVVVSNVAPSFTVSPNISGRANQSVTVSATFTDPGTADTFSTLIDWGDGSPQENPLVNGRTITASHVYTRPGTFTVQIGVQDDDGGQDITSLQATITPPPRGDWQNPANQFDVNANGVIEPLDALLVINELTNRVFSAPGTGSLPPAPAVVPQWLDVNADDFVGPQDALFVINNLGANAALSASIDFVFEELEDEVEQLDVDRAAEWDWLA